MTHPNEFNLLMRVPVNGDADGLALTPRAINLAMESAFLSPAHKHALIEQAARQRAELAAPSVPRDAE